jgi:hypothetical protein
MMLNEKGKIRMSIFTKSILITYLCMVGASFGHCDTVGQSQKVSSTTNLLPTVLSEAQLQQMVCLIATNLLPLLEAQMEADCLKIARELHNYPTDQRKRELLEYETILKHPIYSHVRASLMPFFSREEEANDELVVARSYLERKRESAVLNMYGAGGGPDLPYEDALKIFKPSLRITHAILSSYFKAKMYAEISDVLLEQLKDKDKSAFDAITEAMKLIELDKKDTAKVISSDGNKK